MTFQFKEFSIGQNKTAMKVGTDGVLLGAWCSPKEGNILDIGTGTGLIALMLAQRTKIATIDAVEIEKSAYSQALDNIKKSKWTNRINIHNLAIQNYDNHKKYDLIVSNPPFFSNSTKADYLERNNARHTDTLSHSNLLDVIINLLKRDGVFSLILPVSESNNFVDLISKKGMYLIKKCFVKPNPTKIPKRILMEFSFSPCNTLLEELIIETDTRHQYTKEYISLTKDFYLNF